MRPRLSQFGVSLAISAVAAVLSLTAWAFSRPRQADADSLVRLPMVMLWAWERPENFSFLKQDEAGVVVLAGTIVLRGDVVEVRPRMQPVVIPAGVAAFPVIRIETDRADRPRLSAEQRREVVAALLAMV